jgi:hypothetical protein
MGKQRRVKRTLWEINVANKLLPQPLKLSLCTQWFLIIRKGVRRLWETLIVNELDSRVLQRLGWAIEAESSHSSSSLNGKIIGKLERDATRWHTFLLGVGPGETGRVERVVIGMNEKR